MLRAICHNLRKNAVFCVNHHNPLFHEISDSISKNVHSTKHYSPPHMQPHKRTVLVSDFRTKSKHLLSDALLIIGVFMGTSILLCSMNSAYTKGDPSTESDLDTDYMPPTELEKLEACEGGFCKWHGFHNSLDM